jgi:hypothetical protein
MMREDQELVEQAVAVVEEHEQGFPCSGIIPNKIIETRRKAGTERPTKGFLNLIGNSIGNLGCSISHDLPPNLAQPTIQLCVVLC